MGMQLVSVVQFAINYPVSKSADAESHRNPGVSPQDVSHRPFLASISRLWHVRIIITGKQNLHLLDFHRQHGPFIRVAPNEVSVSHPDGVRKVLLQPMRKGVFYSATSLPDWRFQTPMSARDPHDKIERSKAFGSGYAVSNVLKCEFMAAGCR